MKTKILLSVMAIVMAVAMITGGTMAYFTDSETSAQSTFTTGTLDLGLVGNGGSNVINLGNIGNLAPGDSTEEASITLTNNGTLDLAFVGGLQLVGSDAQKALAKKLVIKEMSITLVPKHDSSKTGSSEEFILEGAGAGTYAAGYNDPRNYGKASFSYVDGKITLADWLEAGSGITGVQNCFWKSALKPGWSWVFTFQFTFDASATNELQGTQMGLQFVSQASQVNAEAVAGALEALGFPHSSTYIELDRLQRIIAAQD